MVAGKFNRRITLQSGTASKNARNEAIITWSTLATVWAERVDVSASESFRAQEVGAELTTRFRIRYSATVAGLNPNDRLIYRGVTYNITGVREVQRNRILEIDTVARDDVAASGV